MLKNKFVKKFVFISAMFLFGIGIVLSGIGYAMNRDIGYLKEDGHHKWYQIIYVDKDDVLHIGINLNDYMIIGGIDIPLK